MKAKLQELIERYELRLKAEGALTALHGDKKAEGILFELRHVIKDLKAILAEVES